MNLCFVAINAANRLLTQGGRLALWIRNNADLEAPVEVFVVHKGVCDKTKSAKLRDAYGPQQHELTDELSQHIIKLLLNTNMVKVESVKGDEVEYDTQVLDRAFKMNEMAASI